MTPLVDIYFAALLMVSAITTGGAVSPIPLEKGTVWTYEGTASWTVVNSNVVQSDRIRWTTTVIDAFDVPAGRAALVSGLPLDLAWYEPGQAPELSLLVLDSSKLFRIPVESLEAAHQTIERLRKGSNRDYATNEPLLDLPLAKHKRWGGDPDRKDEMYCWFVADESEPTLAMSGFQPVPNSKLFTLIYRTLPDDQTLQIVPGLGIVRFAYRHHGTVAHTDVSLVTFQRTPTSAKQDAPADPNQGVPQIDSQRPMRIWADKLATLYSNRLQSRSLKLSLMQISYRHAWNQMAEEGRYNAILKGAQSEDVFDKAGIETANWFRRRILRRSFLFARVAACGSRRCVSLSA